MGVLGAAPNENGDGLGSSFFSCTGPNENNDGFAVDSVFSGAAPNEKGAVDAGKVGFGASSICKQVQNIPLLMFV